ncbi:MAG: PAS domain S-box protein [Methylobacter sp.]
MRSIHTYLTATLLLCILLPTGLIGAAAYWFIYNDIRDDRINDVGEIADARYEELRLWLYERNEQGRDLLNTLIASCRASDNGINACSQPKLEQFIATHHAAGATLHSGSDKDFAVGRHAVPFDQLKQTALTPGQIAIISRNDGVALLSMFATDPASGITVVTAYPGHELQNIFANSPLLGQSGETFLVDNQGYFITNARYPSKQGITESIATDPMQRCLHGENSDSLGLDYRDAAIIHGFRHVPEIGGGCIMAHIEQNEAFTPLKRLLITIATAAVLFACLASLISAMLGRGMAKPIVALANMARALARGDFSHRVTATYYREIAELAQLFNNMAEQLDLTLCQLKTSEHELAEKVVELRGRNRQYDSVIKNISDGFWLVDKRGCLLEVNPAYVRMSGYSSQELLAMSIVDLEALESPEQIAEHIRHIMRYGTDTFETKHRRKDGSIWDVEISSSYINEVDGYFVSFVRDISLRKSLENEQKANDAKFRSIIEVSPVPMVLNDERLNITFLNPAFMQTFGYSVSDIPTLEHWWRQAFPDPDYRRWAESAWQTALTHAKQGQVDLMPLEIAIRCKNGHSKTVLATAAGVQHDFADIHLTVLYDISWRKQFEAKFDAIFNASVEGIITIDMSNRIVSANAAVETIFGYQPVELIGCDIGTLIPTSQENSNAYGSPYAITCIGQIQEIEGRHKNGSVIPLDLSAAEFLIDNERYFANIVRDVSLRKYREQQDKEHLNELAHVTRLGLMGEMASGIAHEVNQPLSSIATYAQVSINLINNGNPDPLKLIEILYKTQQQALRAGRIIHRMREFVKFQSKHCLSVNINNLIHDAVSLCIAELKQNNIKLMFNLENNLPPVLVDQIQIEQVIINLVRNSIEALQTQPARQQRQLHIASLLTPDHTVQVRIQDNGPGFDEEQRQQILTPFYTTKADGMGMGLSITQSIIAAHDGTLQFDGQPGNGATFYFTLPAHETAVS